MISIIDYGAESGENLNTDKIQAAIDSTAEKGGGTVFVPSGIFYTGALFLKDNVELHLSSGAVLRFYEKQESYPTVTSRWEGVKTEVYASCIYATNARNISITGRGVIDGNGFLWWKHIREHTNELKFPRPKLISFDNCENVLLRDVTLINSPSWTVNPILCRNVTCDNLTIKNPYDSPNTDGINPDSCVNVRISNCHIDVGDDCIAIKSGTEDSAEMVACENITISNCTMVHGHGGIVIGSEMSGGVRNVTVTNCVFQKTDRGIRLKSRRGRGGTVEDIRVSNIVMDEVICPFVINLYYFCGVKGNDRYVWDKNPYPVTKETPSFKNIHFANITAKNVSSAAGFIYGLSEQYVEEVTFSNVHVTMAKEAVPAVPAMMSDLEKMAYRGFFIGCAKELLFDNVCIENHVGEAFHMENTSDIRFRECRSKRPRDIKE